MLKFAKKLWLFLRFGTSVGVAWCKHFHSQLNAFWKKWKWKKTVPVFGAKMTGAFAMKNSLLFCFSIHFFSLGDKKIRIRWRWVAVLSYFEKVKCWIRQRHYIFNFERRRLKSMNLIVSWYNVCPTTTLKTTTTATKNNLIQQ